MKRKYAILLMLLAASLLLGGCAMKTVEELYCLPKRPQVDNNLQSAIDRAMNGLEYSAPQSGDHRHVVQTADLDGDGTDEYLLFAKDNSEKPLKILIFCKLASGYVLMDTIEGYGFGFDFVAYEQMDDRPGMEIVVGRLVSEEVVRSVSVYRFSSGFSRHMLSTAYSRMSVADLNGDGKCELFLLNQGKSETENGSVLVYSYQDDELQRTAQLPTSTTASAYKQIQVSNLSDGTTALYVTCQDNDVLVTDIFVCREGVLRGLASGLISESLNHNLVYPDDVDGDGVLELARLIPMYKKEDGPLRYLVQWYSINSDGTQSVKLHTYHNYQDNWYIEVESEHCEYLTVDRTKDQCKFYLYDPMTEMLEPVLLITALPDADREEQAQKPGRIVLYSGDSVIYVADLLDAAEKYGLDKDSLLSRFSPIRLDLNTQED